MKSWRLIELKYLRQLTGRNLPIAISFENRVTQRKWSNREENLLWMIFLCLADESVLRYGDERSRRSSNLNGIEGYKGHNQF